MKKPTTYPVTLWSDEDGVIAVYEPHAYQGDDENNLPFMEPGIRYFNGLEPDTTIIRFYRLLQEKDKIPVTVLTNIIDRQDTIAEHTSDKKAWTARHMPFLDMHKQFHVIPIPVTKAETAKKILGRPLKTTDILISDYNKDLETWSAEGGTGIKYSNGINNPDSWPGLKIHTEDSPDTLRTKFLQIINQLQQTQQEVER